MKTEHGGSTNGTSGLGRGFGLVGSSRVGIGLDIDRVDEEPLTLMNHGQGAIEKMTPESDAFGGIALRDFVKRSFEGDDVVVRDTAFKADAETIVEPGAILGEVKGTRVLMEPLGGGLSTE